MTARRWVLALAVALLPLHAQAQLDDLLTPLTPQKPVEKKKEPRKKKVRKQPRAQPAAPELVAPAIPSRTELLVKVVGPADAQVQVDGQPIRADTPIEVDPGEHTVVVGRPGFAEVTLLVRAKPDKTTEVSAVLEATSGILAVTSDVPGSRVFVDGKLVGDAPVSGFAVAPGVREVKILRDGFEEHVSRIVVRAGRDYSVTGNLRPMQGETRTLMAVNGDRPERPDLAPRLVYEDGSDELPPPGLEPELEAVPLHQRWYVWAGAGAVVATGVAFGVKALIDKRPISQDEVCQPCAGVLPAGAGAVRF